MGDDVFTFATSRRIRGITRERIGDKVAELPQQSLHLTLNGCGGGLIEIFSHRLQQVVKLGVGVAEVQMAEDADKSG